MKIEKKTLLISIVVVGLLLTLSFGLKNILFRPKGIEVEERPKAKVAVVIDDWGYNLQCMDLLKEIKVPVTISVLPALPYSAQIAKTAHQLGQEVILHLPLEPEMAGRKIGLEQHTITTQMSEEEVVKDQRHQPGIGCSPGTHMIRYSAGIRYRSKTKLQV
ncbi:MAG: divergent polysaccharide deacetylase family protein, partial [Candidatus Omnitrophica bacterium]|nr:divergent polysaccharide deacetylase family protein [Candidatus Omnitrophota bacterium]